MDCKKAVSMIDRFLNDELGLKDTKEFINHIAFPQALSEKTISRAMT